MGANAFPMGQSPRKAMASSGIPAPSDNFGISQVPGGVPSITHMDRNHMPTAMADGDRHPPIPGAKNKLHNQRNPDHGPHHQNAAFDPHSSGLRGGKLSSRLGTAGR
jgi:hypothetical protein